MKRDSVVIYRNLFEALQGVSDKAYKRIMNAILKYALDGEEVDLTGAEKAVFMLAKTQIDSNNKKYEAGKLGAEHGAKGGRPRKNVEEEKPQENPNETPTKPLNVKCKMLNDNNLKESKYVDKEDNTNYTCASYEEVMQDFGVSELLKPSLWEFIKHCQLNGHMVTNDKLEGIIIELDRHENELDKVELVRSAINGGYYDIKRST